MKNVVETSGQVDLYIFIPSMTLADGVNFFIFFYSELIYL